MSQTIYDDLMKLFFRSRSPILLVVEDSGLLLGVISKERLVREMSDLSRSNDLSEIPSDIVDIPIENEILQHLKAETNIPAIRINGSLYGEWSKSDVLKGLEKIPIPNVAKFEPEVVKKPNKKDELRWFKDLILENITHPLFVTDLTGKTLFYNKEFKSKIIGNAKLQNLKSGEVYFLEANRSLVAKALQTGHDINAPQDCEEPVAGFDYIMTPLGNENDIKGYLYEFIPHIEPKKASKKTEFPFAKSKTNYSDDLYKVVFERETKNRLNELLAEYEQKIIDLSLAHFKGNISHAAKFLGIPRQTLQFRIKKLFPEKLADEVLAPRKRKTQTPAKVVTAKRVTPPKKKSTKVTAKKTTKSKSKTKSAAKAKTKRKTTSKKAKKR